MECNFVKRDIFISYRHTDFQLAALTDSYLEELKYSVFWDVELNSMDLPNGEFPEVLENYVQNCKDFILIITKDTFDKDHIFREDDWIYREVKLALKFNRHIVAFMVDGIDFPSESDLPEDLRSLITNKQLYRFPIEPNKREKEEIYRDITKKLKSKPWITDYQELIAGSENYDSSLSDEANRLKMQAENTADMDKQILEQIITENPGRKFTVLDAGCAKGFVTRSRFSAECYEKVLGIDRNEQVVKEAVNYSRANPEFHKIKYGRVDLEGDSMMDDMQQLMYAQDIEKFDIIFLSQVLHHLHDPIRCLQKLRQLLAPNGYIIIRNSDDRAKIAGNPADHRLIKDIIRLTYAVPGIADRNAGGKIYGWLQKCGFRDIDVRTFMRATTKMGWEERMKLFHESFGWRRKIYREEEIGSKNYVDMQNKLNELEQRFPDTSFWYSELDFIGVGHSSGGRY